MAKSQTLAVLVAFATVAWRENNNYRKNYGSEEEVKKLRNSLASTGWHQDYVVPACPISKEELEAEMTERAARWENLKSTPTADAAVERQMFEQLYTKDGKLIKPEYSANAGFRRARTFLSAMAQRLRDMQKPGHESDRIDALIPVRITTYANKAERLLDQQRENEIQGVGAKKMEDLEKLRVTHDLFMEGARQIDIRRMYSDATGQKLFAICQADLNWPQLNIFDRMFKDPADPNFIKWGPIRQNELTQLNKRYEIDKKRAQGLPISSNEQGSLPITQEDVDSYFRDMKDKTGEPVMMKKSDIKNGWKNSRLLIAQHVFGSVLNGTQTNLSKYLANGSADALNSVTKLIDAGSTAKVNVVLNSMEKEPDLLTLIAALLQEGKGDEVRKLLAPLLTVPATAA